MRVKKSYKINRDNSVITMLLKGATSVRFPYDEGRANAYEFGKLGLSDSVSTDLAIAFYRYYCHRAVDTRNSAYAAFKYFARFLRQHFGRKARNNYTDVMVGFFAYLSNCRGPRSKRKLSVRHAQGYYNALRLSLDTIRDRPLWALLGTSLPLPPYRLKNDRQIKARLTPEEFREVLKATEVDIERVRQERPNVITAAVLFPYAIRILARTWGNPSSILDVDIDCSTPHPLDDRRTVIDWKKPRSRRRQYRSFLSSAKNEPPSLIREIAALTESYRNEAPARIRKKLFLIQQFKYGRIWGNPSKLRYRHITRMLSDFITRHGLPKFTLRILRISAIRGSLFETKNIRLVQRLANHASRISTLVYAESKEALEICDAIIADGQASFRQFLLIDLINQKAISSMLKVDIETARAIAAGKYATLSGFTCRNPYEGKAPGSVAGELCEHFLACFRCENAVLGKDAMSAGRLIQFRDALLTDKTKMRPERFEFLYGWVVMSLERFILPLYTPAVLQEGTRIAKTLPPLPSFVE